MDYRELLLKYINHVGEEEGTTFLNWDRHGHFSIEEWEELQELDAESYKYMKRRAD